MTGAAGLDDAGRLFALVVELSEQNATLREQFSALSALFHAEVTLRKTAAIDAAGGRTPAVAGPPTDASTEVLSYPSVTKPYVERSSSGFEDRLAEVAASQRHREEQQSLVAEEMGTLRTDLSLLRGERDGLARSAMMQNAKLEQLSAELAEWRQFADQSRHEVSFHADAARTARAETAALKTLLIARYPLGTHMQLTDARQMAAPAWPPEAAELSRFTAAALGRDRASTGAQ
jgi:hypothetical protein